MNKRYQVNIRLDRELVAEIDRLADEDAVDRSEMARRLLGHGLSERRLRRAIDEYRSGNVTAWRAAEIAGVSLYEMLDRIHEEGIVYDLDSDVFDRVGAMAEARVAVGEEGAPYGQDEASKSAALRERYRPTRVTTLFVGESAPAGGTHFYLANSNLFRATREAFRGGWFHTGDLGVMHPDRYIELKDRAKDIVISGGENISTVEVEQAVVSHDAVLETAVIGRPDPQWGERPIAFVVLRDDHDVSADELRIHTRSLLAAFKVPDEFIFVRELPHTATGKVQKFDLRARAGSPAS